MTDTDVIDGLVTQLGSYGVRTSQLFGKPALKDVEGKTFACLHDGALACRLGQGTQAHTEAMAMGDTHLFDPSGQGRPMRDWVSLPEAHSARWAEFASAAMSVPH
ncbi:hypothetical protein [Umezawaea sp. Da 62-37]|uniref:hypothetical protein n=1 Tax=Umezawaea sp. Da 62-37 TaxID=3075927 RepID=UPI0028F6EEA9|nr:hypothetical protein [Umezawaea sp. Da 62-37]WNV90028.1 hypothetical protein RM788_17540 [Umezawaea sp. Da 62-37]